MSKALCFLAVVCLASCAPFKPVLAPEAPHYTTAQNPYAITLKVNGLEGYQNYTFYNLLKKKLQCVRTKKPLTLIINLSESDYNLSYASDATTTRTQHDSSASYELWENDMQNPSTKPKSSGILRSTVSYNLDANDEFSTLNSRLGADQKNLQGLVEETFREVLSLLHE